MSYLIKRFQCDPDQETIEVEIFWVKTIEAEGKILEIGEWQHFVTPFTTADQEYLQNLQSRLDISQSSNPAQTKPDWGLFNRLCALSEDINLILQTATNQFAVIKLMILIGPAGYAKGLSKVDYPLFQAGWAQIILSLPTPPTLLQIQHLNELKSAASMDFYFDESGLIVFDS